jgi:hypothetical protein
MGNGLDLRPQVRESLRSREEGRLLGGSPVRGLRR